MNLTPWHRKIAQGVAAAHSMEAANETPQPQPFLVKIKRGNVVVREFEAMGVDALAVVGHHEELCGEGEYLTVTRAGQPLAEGADRAYHDAKVSGDLDRERQRRAVEDQQNMQPRGWL